MKAELIRVYGSDDDVVDAARVSFDKQAVNYTKEQNAKLINYLAKHNHFSPFTHVFIKMRETVPIFVARQRFKHRIGFEYNETSRRYVDDEPELFEPAVWRGKPVNAKQGSSDEVIEKIRIWDPIVGPHESEYIDIHQVVNQHHHNCLCVYNSMIKEGVTPEQARLVLPQSMMTSYIVTGSIAAWARALKLRSDPHAQVEIQQLAAQWATIIGGVEELKYSWNALTNQILS